MVDDFSIVPVSEDEVPSTALFDFLTGAFEVGDWRIPYFSTTMSFKQAAADLRLTHEMPGAHRIRWTISELFQRDIDWARVQNDLFKYLSSPGRPQFFNAITIALFPYVEQDEVVHSFDSGTAWKSPPLGADDRYAKLLEVGPIRLGFHRDWTNFTDPGFLLGRGKWNTDQVHGVAIDGQHRLAAIKEFVRRRGSSSSRIPVLLLLFDPRVGFVGPGEPDMTSVMRRLFIDLNKHSKPVSRARTILLDDRDPISRCVRALLSNELAPDFASLDNSPPTLPLGLVDWHSEEAKFDRGPYLATVLGLDWAAMLLLGHKPVSDMANFAKIEAQIRSFGHRLSVDLGTALERLADNRERLVPFAYTDEELDRISGGFARTWNASLVHLLTAFSPYADLIHLRKGDGSQSLEWQMWFKLAEAAKGGAAHSATELQEFLKDLSIATPPIFAPKLEAPLASHDAFKRDSLAFNVAFQRAYLFAFALFYQFTDGDLGQFALWCSSDAPDLDDAEESEPELGLLNLDDLEQDEEVGVADGGLLGPPEHREGVRSSRFVELINAMLLTYPELLDVDAKVKGPAGKTVYFWSGTLRKPEAGIDFALGASTRAGDLLYLCVSLMELRQACRGHAIDFDEIWAEIVQTSDYGPFKKMYWASRRLWERDNGMGGRILAARGEAFSKVAAQAEVRARLHAIWVLLQK